MFSREFYIRIVLFATGFVLTILTYVFMSFTILPKSFWELPKVFSALLFWVIGVIWLTIAEKIRKNFI